MVIDETSVFRNPLVFSYLGIYSVKVISTEIYMLECPLDKDFVTKLMKTKPYSYFGYSTNSRWIGQLKQINFVLLIAVWTFSLNVVHDSTLFVICLSYVGLGFAVNEYYSRQRRM